MRVVHIITGLEDGGAEGALYRLCVAASGGGVGAPLVISLGGPGKYGPLLEAVGVRVVCLEMPRGRVTLAGVVRLVRLLRAERPDVVQTWMYHANLIGGVAARLAGVRRVAWGIRHSGLSAAASRGTRLVDWLCARLSRRVPEAIVSCSARAAADHVQIGYFSPYFAVISNGYDSEKFAPDPVARERVRAELGVAPGTFLIGAVGRFVPEKDHANLLAALRNLPPTDWRLALVGTGMDAANEPLRDLIAGLADRVLLLGRRDDVPALMPALDLHVLASASEAFPNVVAEAMACGTPGIVTDVGDAAEIVGATGWVVPPRNPEALAAAIATAMTQHADAAAWRDRQKLARQRIVDSFSIERMRDAYLALWERMVQERP